ncbi:MAG TPA: glutamate-cysteine ligase family protein [Streptosporangiaceae bacterium]|jgi:glutamate--cysteine ligase
MTPEEEDDPAAPLALDGAYARAHRAALTDSALGPVGLEVESHLVTLGAVAEPVSWDQLDPLPAAVLDAAGRSKVTLEPGGQFELSGPPEPGIAAAVGGLRRDAQRARLALGQLGLGLAHAGADPLRPPRRINPKPRYEAMEQHFAATGRAGPGMVMMNSTAALQVNLQAGPARCWPQRLALAHRLGPTLLAISASSPWLSGRDTGWKSARQRAWNMLDARCCGPLPGFASSTVQTAADPPAAWARYALRAPVSYLGAGGSAEPVRGCVAFERWASGAVRLGGRAPTNADLDRHLTTLFPPVRLRGWLELRYLDMSAPRWWPAVAAVTATLMDDPVAADFAAEVTEQAAPLWTEAARDGLGNAVLARAARRCLRIAAERVPAELALAVSDLAELVESGRCPGDLLAERIGEIGPRAALEELAHA